MAFYVKQQVKMKVQVRNEQGVLTSPAVGVFKVKPPNGSAKEVPATESSPGTFYAYETFTEHGTWLIRFEGSGGLVAAYETEVLVEKSGFYA